MSRLGPTGAIIIGTGPPSITGTDLIMGIDLIMSLTLGCTLAGKEDSNLPEPTNEMAEFLRIVSLKQAGDEMWSTKNGVPVQRLHISEVAQFVAGRMLDPNVAAAVQQFYEREETQ